MASNSKLTVRVSSARGSSTVQFSTTGRYVSLTTGGINETLLLQPIQPTSSAHAFWQSVLTLVQAQLALLEV
jgi:hypothetical protein